MISSTCNISPSSSSSNTDSKIAKLKKQLGEAQKQLSTALKSGDAKVAGAQAKLIEARIASLEAQISQLVESKALTNSKSVTHKTETTKSKLKSKPIAVICHVGDLRHLNSHLMIYFSFNL